MRVEATSVHAGTAPGRSARLLARWVLVSLALVAVLAALIGLAFAGSTGADRRRCRDRRRRRGRPDADAGTDAAGAALRARRTRTGRLHRGRQARTRSRRRRSASRPTGPRRSRPRRARARASARSAASAASRPSSSARRSRRRCRRTRAALDFKLAGLAQAIDQRHVEAKLVRRGLAIEVVRGSARPPARPESGGRDRSCARSRGSNAGSRSRCPFASIRSPSRRADLAPAARRARIALSAPVRLQLGETRWKLPRWRIAELLSLPVAGETQVAIAGPGAEAWFDRLRKTVEHAPVDATFAVDPGGIDIVPDKPGLGIDVPATAKALLAAATSPTARTAELAVRTTKAERTDCRREGHGDHRRRRQLLHDLRRHPEPPAQRRPRRSADRWRADRAGRDVLVQRHDGRAHGREGLPGGARDHQRRAPDRARRRHLPGLDDRLQRGLRGRARRSTSATNHALYISHYPLGRDATVNYPDQDLKFTNDTDKWLLLRTFVGSGSLTVNLYGTPQNRRVETTEQPLRVVGAPQVKRVPDPTLLKGTSEVDEYGQPARATSVSRTVYDADGNRPARGHLVLVLPLRAEGRPGGHEAEAEAEAEAQAAATSTRSTPRATTAIPDAPPASTPQP